MIKVSIIGAGNMASHYLNYLDQFKNKYKILGINSRTRNKCLNFKKKYKYLKIYPNLSSLLDEKPHLIIIAVSEESLLNVLKITLQSKIVHLIEKPLGVNYLQYFTINKLIKKNKTKVFISLNRRYYLSVNKLDKIKNLHKPYHIKIVDHQSPININKSDKDPKVIKYWMYSNSVHLVDLISLLSDNKIKTKSRKKVIIDNEKILYTSSFKLKNNSIITYICFWNLDGRMSVEFNSNKINCFLKPIEQISIIQRNKNKVELFKEPLQFKPGFKGLFKNIDLYFKGKKHQLVSSGDYSKTINLIKFIYGT